MELNDVRIAFMLVSVAVFLGVAWWAYSPSRRGRFEQVGRFILDEGEFDTHAMNKKEGSRS